MFLTPLFPSLSFTNSFLPKKRSEESYNNMAHVQLKGQFFLFRIKDLNSHGILQGFDLMDKDIFDFPISLSLTRKQNNATNMDNQIIKIIELIYNPV